MDFDAIVIGGGHNGLVCAWYLARGGKRVLVLERREIVGGAAVTEEFVPGFRNSTASYTLGLLDPRIIADMNLHAHGLRIVARPSANFLTTHHGRYLLIAGGQIRAATTRLPEAHTAAPPPSHSRLTAAAR